MATDRVAATIHEQAHALYLRDAKRLAEQTLSDPYVVGGRGSVLENDLARRVLALCEEYDHA